MSHRKPLHPPTKLLLRMQKLAPALVEALAAEAPSSTPALLSTIKAAMPSLSPRELGSVCMRVLPIAAWTTSKHVYEIDGEVAGSLSGQSLDGELPVELFERLPYPSLYVEDASSFRGFGTRGFLATVLGDNAGGESLWLCFFPSNETQPVQIVSLDVKRGNTIAKAVEALVETDTVFIGSNTFALSNANLRRELSRAVNLLLYVVSSEADAEVVYRPPSGRKEGRRSNPETVTLVGSRMGHAIGKARIRATASERDATGHARSVAPHVRKAHWQHYWVGKRKDRDDGRFGDELVLRWVPPAFVNARTGDQVEVIHQDRAAPRAGGTGNRAAAKTDSPSDIAGAAKLVARATARGRQAEGGARRGLA